MTLPDFLLARIAEDEGNARAAIRAGEKRFGPGYADRMEVATANGTIDNSGEGWMVAEPRYVLAECEAKRRIVELAEDDIVPRLYAVYGTDDKAEELLRLLALPYADHPDYRDEWRP